MVQQPFNGSIGPVTGIQANPMASMHSPQQQPQPVASSTSLAMPAIAGVPANQQQQSQYSPQADFYQQQLIKGAHQFVKQQQQQQQQNSLRLTSNGLSPVQQPSQQQLYGQSQDSPQQQESLYNGIARQAPIYAPKPTYYGQVQAQAAMYQANGQMQAPAFYNQQPNNQAASIAGGLTVRQLPMQVNGILAPAPNLSPMQQAASNQANGADIQRQSQQQMQQLFQSSYHSNMNQQLPNGSLDMMQVQNPGSFLSSASMMPTTQQASQPLPLQRSHENSVRWPIEEQTRAGQLIYPAPSERRQTNALPIARANFSDRDSISTVSRFNQFDERRSITMRSQYTSNQRANALGNSNRFGFLELTTEALKRALLAKTGSARGETADKHKLQQNLGIGANTVGKTSTLPNSPAANGAKVTLTIDSGEDYFFKRKVFSYQLVILRALNIVCCAFVLLSPVAMLLIPKMEGLFHSMGQDYASEPEPSSQTPGAPSVTHAVGLSGPNRNQLAQRNSAHSAFMAIQPQWRISECSTDCDGPLIGFVVRLIMLTLAYWAIMLRPQTATLPRIDFYRCLLVSMAVLLTAAYWLFFTFRVFDKRFNDFELQYMTIVQFSVSMLESLILLHYLAIALLELRHRKKVYCLKVIRSPDGASTYYSCGPLSIQKCAQFVLEKYHRDFKSYNQHAEQVAELEEQLAREAFEARDTRQADDERERSRPTSPASSHRGTSSSRRSSRHHSRSGRQRDDRSPSPAKSTRSRSHRDRREERTKTRHQLDAKEQVEASSTSKRAEETEPTRDQAETNNANSSAEQSSDANTNQMKESSLETVRAANSGSDLLISRQNTSSGKECDHNNRDNEDDGRSRRREQRDETESVRSARSRRSTSRSTHHGRRHHSHHRERSSSRTNDHRPSELATVATNSGSGPVEEHERKVRRRKLRLLVAVEDAFEQMKRTDEEGK